MTPFSYSRIGATIWMGAALAMGCGDDAQTGCPGAEDTTNCAPPDGIAACASDPDCAGNASTPVCDTESGTCVQCVAPDKLHACTDTSPVCGDDHLCRACTAHSECASSACLPDGSCADEGDVAYVAHTGTDNTSCTKDMPCRVLQSAADTNRPYIKFAPGLVKDDQTTTISGQTLTLLAEPGAQLDRDGDGPILQVEGTGTDVRIFDLEIIGATGSADPAIRLTAAGGMPKLSLTRVKITNNQGGGIAASGGALSVSQSTISNNQGGGIAVSGGATFDITNNIISRNGDPDVGTFGGLNLGIAMAGTNRLEFNTIVDNRASAGVTRVGGVACDIVSFLAPNNLIARNAIGIDTTAPNSQTLGGCTYPTSIIQADVTDIGFESPDMSPYSYRLTSASSAIDAATTTSSIVVDIDGDPRPQGAGKDIGADEYMP